MLTTAGRVGAQRIPALDFTKGTLVLFMVLYHWINYFIGIQWAYYRYLRFLSPSFIFISGFMISNVYLSKYDAANPQLTKRLVTRGLKLIAIFLALNIARDCMLPRLSTGGLVANLLNPESILATFVTGDFTSKLVAFFILVPIAYLLMLSGILMVPQRIYRYTFHVVCVFLFIAISMLDLMGAKNQDLELVAIGMLGVLAGFTPIERINKFVRRPYLLAFAYLLYTIAIAIWNVPFPLEVVGTCLSVMVIYLVGSTERQPGRIRNEVILLGKYSLFAYISQIAILQILKASLWHLSFGIPVLVVSAVAAFALTVISVEVVDRARLAAPSINRLYKAVFN